MVPNQHLVTPTEFPLPLSTRQWQSAAGQIQISQQLCIFVSLELLLLLGLRPVCVHMQMNLVRHSKNAGKACCVCVYKPISDIYLLTLYMRSIALDFAAAIKCNYSSLIPGDSRAQRECCVNILWTILFCIFRSPQRGNDTEGIHEIEICGECGLRVLSGGPGQRGLHATVAAFKWNLCDD